MITAWTADGEIGVVKVQAPTVAQAVGKYLADCEARHLGWETMRKYRHLLEDRFLPWAERKAVSTVRHVTVDRLRQFGARVALLVRCASGRAADASRRMAAS